MSKYKKVTRVGRSGEMTGMPLKKGAIMPDGSGAFTMMEGKPKAKVSKGKNR